MASAPGFLLGMTQVEKKSSNSLETALLAAIVDSSDDAIVSKDLNGIVQTWNSAAERIFGYPAKEMIGRPIKCLLPPDRPDEEDTILAQLRAGKRVDHFQTERITKDGRRIHVSLTISPIRNKEGTVIGASKIARDITAQKEIEIERDQLLERERELRLEAERANRVKNEFLATLSHELRTPLMAISGWAQILNAGRVDEETTRRAAEVIRRNTQLQTQLIDELLDMNRILMGKLRLDLQPVDLCAIIEAAMESVEPASNAKKIRFRKSLDPRAGSVRGDPTRLQQIVWNLLSNAVKFTPENGDIEICLSRVNSHVEISVTDTGIGIAVDFLPYVFDRFSQMDTSTTRQYGGLGLGLAIVKHLVELHGGSVQVRSAGPGTGSTFRVNLPFPATLPRTFTDVHPHSTGLSNEEWNTPDLSGRRLLVVDDDRDACELVTHLLSEAGADITQTHSATQALSLLETRPFDAILSDIGMPEMDGFQLVREIRRLPGSAGQTPAIALTAFGRTEDRRNAMISGFDVFLSKPIDASELMATVARVISRSS
jgi:PAS domain S-box-containing protein